MVTFDTVSNFRELRNTRTGAVSNVAEGTKEDIVLHTSEERGSSPPWRRQCFSAVKLVSRPVLAPVDRAFVQVRGH